MSVSVSSSCAAAFALQMTRTDLDPRRNRLMNCGRERERGREGVREREASTVNSEEQMGLTQQQSTHHPRCERLRVTSQIFTGGDVNNRETEIITLRNNLINI